MSVGDRSSTLSHGKKATEALVVFLTQSAVTLVYLRPIWRLWRSSLAPDLGDPLFNTYVLDWTIARWHEGLRGLWDTNFFHPVSGTLAFSDHLLSPALFAAPFAALTCTSIGTYNLLFFLSFPLAATVAYGVLRAGGSSAGPAFLGATAYAFSHFRWGQASHLQILLAPLIPLVLWTFDRLLAEPGVRRALAFLATYAVHVTGGIYLAYMIHLALVALIANRAVGSPGWRSWLSVRRLTVLSVTAGAAALLCLAVFQPYERVTHAFDLVRLPEEFRQFGAHSVALLTPSHHSPLLDVAEPVLRPLAPRFEGDSWFAEKSLFPGFLPAFLSMAALALLWRRRVCGVRGGRLALVAVPAAFALAAFVAADLYTLGWWPTGVPEWLLVPDDVYTRLGIIFAVALAATLALYVGWCRPRPGGEALSPWQRGLLLATAVCLLATFPVVFEPLSHVVPGMSGMRVPARFFAIASFGVAWLVAIGSEALLAKIPRRGRTAAAALAAVLLFELAPRPFTWSPLPTRSEFPAVYSWLARGDGGAILELPFGDGIGELPYMYFSTLHGRPLVNGYSGYAPPTYRHLREVCCWPVPDENALRELDRLGVSELVVHPVWERSWAHRAYEEWLARVQSGEIAGVREVYSDASGDRVFELTTPEPGGDETSP